MKGNILNLAKRLVKHELITGSMYIFSGSVPHYYNREICCRLFRKKQN